MIRKVAFAYFLVTNLIAAPQVQNEPHLARQLAAILSDRQVQEKEPERLYEAIRTARRHPDPLVIEALINLLEFKRTFDWERDNPKSHRLRLLFRMDRYPATNALAGIGKPALPQLMQLLESAGCDTVRFTNAVMLLQHVYRDDPVEGVRFLEDALGSASSLESRQNLEAALKCYREEKLGFDRDEDYGQTCCSPIQ